MAVGEITDVDARSGWTIVHDGAPFSLEPIELPVGRATLQSRNGMLILRRGEQLMRPTNCRGRLSHITFGPNHVTFGPNHVSLTLDGSAPEHSTLALPKIQATQVLLCRGGGRDLPRQDVADGYALFRRPACAKNLSFVCLWQGVT